jgi:hypothetical protein
MYTWTVEGGATIKILDGLDAVFYEKLILHVRPKAELG